MKKAFLSYSHRDASKAMRLDNCLREAGLRLFYDTRSIEPGAEWTTELVTSLNKSDWLIVCLSPASLESEWCTREVEEFLKTHGRSAVRTVLFEPCIDQIPAPLAALQRVDLSSRAAFDKNIFKLCRSLDIAPASTSQLEAKTLRQSLSERFVGRVTEIWAIHDMLQGAESGHGTTPRHRCVITGIGGVGKSQLAIEYVSRFYPLYNRGALWIDAKYENNQTLDIVSQIQLQLGDRAPALDPGWTTEKKVFALLHTVQGEPAGSVLLVFDDFPESGDLNDCLKYAGAGIYALVTTRGHVGSEYALDLKRMGDVDGRNMLNRFGGDAKALVERLGGLPLALELARAYLDVTKISEGCMLKLIEEQGEMTWCARFAKLHSESLPHHDKDIAGMFTLTYDHVVSTGERDVLHCLCLMEPLAVPKELIAEVIGTNEGDPEGYALAERIGKLASTWGFIGRDDEHDPVVHILIRAYIQDRLRAHTALYEHFVNLIASALDHRTTQALRGVDTEGRRVLAKILPHGEALCAGDIIDPGQAALILCKLGRIRERLGNKARAVADLKCALHKARLVSDESMKAKAGSYLGVSLFHNGEFARSRYELETAESIYQELYETGGLDVGDRVAYATCLDYLGENLRELGRYLKAEEKHRRAIEVAQSAVDDRLKSVEAHANAQLGAIYLRKREKDYDATIAYWQKSLTIAEEIDDAPWVAHFTIDVGFAHLLNDKPATALDLLRKGKRLAENGGFADNIARGAMNLASAEFLTADFEIARQNYVEALRIAEKNHVVRLIWRIQHNLGNVLRAQGEPAAAMERYKEALTGLEALRANYEEDEGRKGFMEHRLRPYQTMIMLALDPHKTPEESQAFECAPSAEQYLGRSLRPDDLRAFYERAKSGLDFEREHELDRNFFQVGDRGYFVETE